MKIYSTLNHRFWRLGGLLAADLIFFGFTNAQKVASVWLIIGYAALILTVYQIARLLFRSRRRAVWLAGAMAGVTALQSVGSLSPRDWTVTLPLIGLGYLYSVYLAKAV